MKRRKVFTAAAVASASVLLTYYILCLPEDLFGDTLYSTVVTDRSGELLGARIADDGQWRFPPGSEVPEKYRTCLIMFEDRCFPWHPGVNPVSIIRAAAGNLKAGRVKSGGSTITMQVIRMSRGKERNLSQKIIEAILATRLEIRCSKKEIMAMYASHAPFGGNVVGIEAAAWRYFGHPAAELSWGEAATLAVLPNSPSDIHPGKNRERLLGKRNRLLGRLLEKGKIDSLAWELACEEPLPEVPEALPQHAWHLVEWHGKHSRGQYVETTVDMNLQKQVEAITDTRCREFAESGIADMAAVIVDVHTGDVLAYCGNADMERAREGRQVDIARSPRSSGSILKPILYCAMLQEGEMLPNTLLPDTPVNINGFSPQNFDMQYDGAVPAREALIRSLNVPSVHMLRWFGVPRFLELLRRAGLSTLDREASDYGLSLILGGAECALYDITRVYASMAREYQSRDSSGFCLRDKAALWYTFDALKEVNRPEEIDWRMLSSMRKAAWKTGTSYGFRDAWAVGVTPDYAVGVWAGNARGRGVPGLTGARTAGPVLFDLLSMLYGSSQRRNPSTGNSRYGNSGTADEEWFNEPEPGDCIKAEVCPESGYLKSHFCERSETMLLPRKALGSKPCPYHRIINGESRFLLPPAMEWYYRRNHPEYRPLTSGKQEEIMEFIYPESGSTIHIPTQLDGTIKGVIFNLAHRNPDTRIYWHLDNEYLGETAFIHRMTLTPSEGPHTVTVTDSAGNTLSIGFRVAG